MKTSFTTKPRTPIATNPIPVAVAILRNSLRSGLVHFRISISESETKAVRLSEKTRPRDSYRTLQIADLLGDEARFLGGWCGRHGKMQSTGLEITSNLADYFTNEQNFSPSSSLQAVTC